MTVETKKNAVDEASWHLIDANGETLGRLASRIAILLMGKHKPTYVPYLHVGDFVIVINAQKILVTGDKLDQKKYYRYSGYRGGINEQTLAAVLEKQPERAITHAVKGMLPKNKLGARMLKRMKVYAGSDHPHQSQVIAPVGSQEQEE